jgi:hypothetical protein
MIITNKTGELIGKNMNKNRFALGMLLYLTYVLILHSTIIIMHPTTKLIFLLSGGLFVALYSVSDKNNQ